MQRITTLLSLLLVTATVTRAQYCSPTFDLGCFNWRILSISAGQVNWSMTDCSFSDQTDQIIQASASDSLPMSVETGVWAGCSVWVDWDQSGSFEESENLYHMYEGNDPSHIYNFNIGVPTGTALGQYRLRVIAGWGSDGFTSGSENGFGPCGAYQYGNFNDFTLDITASTAIAIPTSNSLSLFTASPNPTSGLISITAHPALQGVEHFILETVDGRVLLRWNGILSTKMDLDLSSLPAGVYLIRNVDEPAFRPLRVVKN